MVQVPVIELSGLSEAAKRAYILADNKLALNAGWDEAMLAVEVAVDARRTPKRVLDAHPPDQRAQLGVDRRSASQWARLPTPVAAKAGPMPTHQRLGPDDGENLQDRRKPAVQLDKEPAIMVREPDATMQPAPQNRRSTAFSASSRNFDLNGEARTASTKHSSPIIPPA
jgi:hypothetical protein